MKKNGIHLLITDSNRKLERLKDIITASSKANWKFYFVDRNTFIIRKRLNEEGYPVIEATEGTTSYQLKIALENAENIIIVTEPDDEGEALAFNIKNIALKYSEAKVRRVKIYEMTDDHCRLALSTPELVEENRALGWLARSLLYSLLEDKNEIALRSYLDISKAQSGKLATDPVTLATLEELHKKEIEMRAYRPGKLYFVDCEICKGTAKATSLGFTTLEGAKAHLTKLQDAIDENTLEVEYVSKRIAMKVPPPFTTQTLIKKAYKDLGLNPEETLENLKKLYELGFITFYRTDRLSLNRNFAERIWKYNRTKGMKILDKAKNYSEYQKFGKPGEVIRPTDLIPPEEIDLNNKAIESKLYALIWERTISTQLKPAYVTVQSVDYTLDKGSTLVLSAKGEELDQQGYGFKGSKQTLVENLLRRFGKLSVREEDTKPPRRYNVIGIYKWMDDNGITHQNYYETAVSNIITSKYAFLKDGLFHLDHKGEVLIKAARGLSEDFIDPMYTSQLEEEIRDISEGITAIAPILEHYTTESQALNEVIRNRGYGKVWKKIPKKCPKCTKSNFISVLNLKSTALKRRCKSCKSEFMLIFNEADKLILQEVPREEPEEELSIKDENLENTEDNKNGTQE